MIKASQKVLSGRVPSVYPTAGAFSLVYEVRNFIRTVLKTAEGYISPEGKADPTDVFVDPPATSLSEAIDEFKEVTILACRGAANRKTTHHRDEENYT